MNRSKAVAFCMALILFIFQNAIHAQDIKHKNGKSARFIESDNYHIKVAVPEGLDEEFPINDISTLQKVIGGYKNASGDSVYASVTTKNPYDEMSEEELFTLNLEGVKRIGEILSSYKTTIDHKAAYCFTAKTTAVDPSTYNGVCILRIDDRAVTIYASYENKLSFEQNWQYVLTNSRYIDTKAGNSDSKSVALEEEISKLVSQSNPHDPKGIVLTRLLTKYIASRIEEGTNKEVSPIVVSPATVMPSTTLDNASFKQLQTFQHLKGSNFQFSDDDISRTLVIKTSIDSGEDAHDKLLNLYMKSDGKCDGVFGLKFCVSIADEAFPVIKIAHHKYIYQQFAKEPERFRAEIDALIPGLVDKFKETIPELRKVVFITGQASPPYIVENKEEISSEKQPARGELPVDAKADYLELVSAINNELPPENQRSEMVKVFDEHAEKLLKKWEREAPKEVVHDMQTINNCTKASGHCMESMFNAIQRLGDRGVEGRGAALTLVGLLESGFAQLPPEIFFWKSATEVRIEAANALVNMDEAGAIALVFAYETGLKESSDYLSSRDRKALSYRRLVTASQALQYIFSVPVNEKNIQPSELWIEMLLSAKPEYFSHTTTHAQSDEKVNDKAQIKSSIPWYENELLVVFLIVIVILIGYKFTR